MFIRFRPAGVGLGQKKSRNECGSRGGGSCLIAIDRAVDVPSFDGQYYPRANVNQSCPYRYAEFMHGCRPSVQKKSRRICGSNGGGDCLIAIDRTVRPSFDGRHSAGGG